MRELTYAQAGVEAVAEEMRKDPRIFYMSTDPAVSLMKEFGNKRVRATPIAEGALTGIAIGAAGSGYRPIMDWRQVTFSFVAMDQIVNQAAKIHYMFGGQRTFPVLYRANVGGGTRLAAQHCQCPYSMFMNLSGLKMFLPSTPSRPERPAQDGDPRQQPRHLLRVRTACWRPRARCPTATTRFRSASPTSSARAPT